MKSIEFLFRILLGECISFAEGWKKFGCDLNSGWRWSTTIRIHFPFLYDLKFCLDSPYLCICNVLAT